MISKDYPKLFTVAEVSKACDISRTSLIRLEESVKKMFYPEEGSGEAM